MPYISPHFTVEELSITQQVDDHGHLLGNVPGPMETLYLRILAATILEPIRELWECPVRVTSGYRCIAVEMKVSGKAYGQHMKGQAADILPINGIGIDEAYRRIWASALPYDQLLLEGTGDRRWVHVSCAPMVDPPRREALTSPDGHQWFVYNPPAGGDQQA